MQLEGSRAIQLSAAAEERYGDRQEQKPRGRQGLATLFSCLIVGSEGMVDVSERFEGQMDIKSYQKEVRDPPRHEL